MVVVNMFLKALQHAFSVALLDALLILILQDLEHKEIGINTRYITNIAAFNTINTVVSTLVIPQRWWCLTGVSPQAYQHERYSHYKHSINTSYNHKDNSN